MKKISVIVPIYNVESYLSLCLDSLASQTISDIEVILVNDGSKDSSGDIAQEYAKKMPHIFKYVAKENGGLSDARNFGMQYVEGEYVAFVDSDDWVSPYMFEKLYKKAKDFNSDIVECQFDYVYGDLHKKAEIPRYNTLEGYMIYAYPNAWNKIYRAEWLRGLNVKFPMGLWHEDIEFFFKIIPFVNIVPVSIRESLYYYRQRSGSIMNTPDRRILDIHKIYSNLFEYYKQDKTLNKYNDVLEYKYVRTTLSNFLKRMLKINDKKFRCSVIKDSYELMCYQCPNWRKNKYLRNVSIRNVYLQLISQFTLKLLQIIIR